MISDLNLIETEILKSLYHVWNESALEGNDNINVIRDRTGINPSQFDKVVDRLISDGLVEHRAFGGIVEITPSGIIAYEQKHMPSDSIIPLNTRSRTLILDELHTIYEAGNSLSSEHYEVLAARCNLDASMAIRNLTLLEKLGYITWGGGGFCRITYLGIDAVSEWKHRVALTTEFDHIEQLCPQQRGRAFQKLFAKLVENQGWEQGEGIRTSHEEMDVVLSKEREFYLAECKWEKEPVEGAVVRELFGKLANRIDVRGLLVSMSGFSSGAIKQAEDYIGQKVILLFGPDDVRSILEERASFDSLLNAKYRSLVIHRKAIFDQ